MIADVQVLNSVFVIFVKGLAFELGVDRLVDHGLDFLGGLLALALGKQGLLD